jgi:hypothetical protein
MFSLKKAVSACTVTLLMGTAVLVATAGTASARMVCNSMGECWHTDEHPRYPAELGIQVHPDDWYFHQTWNGDRHYRDFHEGRGYYRNGLWITL